jgi:hypothetical protein
VTVLSPNGGEFFQTGQSVTIQWQVSGASSQRVQFSLDGGATWNPIVTGLSGTVTSTVWSIPTNLVPAGQQASALIRVVANDGTGQQVTDTSNGPFTISGPSAPPPGTGTVTVTSPNGVSFRSGQSLLVQWTGPDSASLYVVRLSIDGGPFNNVSPDLPGSTRSFSFVLPDPPFGGIAQAVIRVAAKDASGSQFAKGDSAPFNLVSLSGL